MLYKLIAIFAILYVLIMQLAALKPSNEQLVDHYNHSYSQKDALCKEHGGYLYGNSYHLVCGDGTEIRTNGSVQ